MPLQVFCCIQVSTKVQFGIPLPVFLLHSISSRTSYISPVTFPGDRYRNCIAHLFLLHMPILLPPCCQHRIRLVLCHTIGNAPIPRVWSLQLFAARYPVVCFHWGWLKPPNHHRCHIHCRLVLPVRPGQHGRCYSCLDSNFTQFSDSSHWNASIRCFIAFKPNFPIHVGYTFHCPLAHARNLALDLFSQWLSFVIQDLITP